MIQLLALCALLLGRVATASRVITPLRVPASPSPEASDYLSSNLASFSIEYAYFEDFIGNKTNPNELTARVLRNIQDRIGVPLSFRPGGISM